MAKKKEYGIEDAIASIQDIIDRCGLHDIGYMNQTIYGWDSKDDTVILCLSTPLFEAYRSAHEDLSEVDIAIAQKYQDVVEDHTWNPIDEKRMYDGDKFIIPIADSKFEIQFNKSIWPLKLRKAEANNFSYAVISGEIYKIIFRKVFELPLEGYSFDLRRSYMVI